MNEVLVHVTSLLITMKRLLNSTAVVLFLIVSICSVTNVKAQSFSVGADFMSRYVWRGVDFGESFSIQPSLEYGAGIFSIGSWASYSIAADGSGANEHDLYFSFDLGPISLGMTDYYFPGPGSANFFDFSNGGDGAHIFEINASVGGTDAFPLSLSANIFVHNEPDNSVYIEASYPFAVEDVELGVSLGIVPQESAFYQTSNFGVTVLSLSATKEIPITDSFGLPVSVLYIVNPTPGLERSFLVFGFSL